MPKKSQTKHKRLKAKRKDRGAITPEVFEEVEQRSEFNCEWCGRPDPRIANCFHKAHLEGRGQLGRGDIPWNIANLCGPSVNTGTCHWKVDSTTEGRRWAREFRMALMEKYSASICTQCNEEETMPRGDGQHICEYCTSLGY